VLGIFVFVFHSNSQFSHQFSDSEVKNLIKAMTTTLKLSFNNEVRRISTPTLDISYDDLLDNARTLFPQLHEASDIQLSWKDDEDDQVFVSSDVELLEALRMMRTGSKGYLRFDIQAKVGIPKPTDKKEKAASAPATPVSSCHMKVSCNECKQTPIIGIRYKCTVRDDYDICSDCEAKTVQPFPMIKFYVPHSDLSASDIVVSINPIRRGCRREEMGHGHCGGGRGNREGKKHRGITCDECGSRGFRGIRYKCTGRSDFDLCASCEGRTPMQPFPMVKVYSPDQCPGGLTVFSASAPAANEATIECDIQLPHGLEFLHQMFPQGAHIRGPWGSATWRQMAREENKRAAEAAPAAGGAPARHIHVRCNECGMKPIVGDRYTCTVRPDFDLCSGCEAKQPQPFAMTKIYYPDQQNGVGPSEHHHPHHHGHGGRGGGRGGMWHGRCGGRGGWAMRSGRVAAAEAAAERARQHHETVEVEKAVHREKEMQELEEDLLDITLRESMTASVSGSSESSSSSVSVTSSFEESKGQDDDASTSTLPTAEASLVAPAEHVTAVMMATEPPAPKPAAPSKPMARFVRDVTMPDGSKVQPCSVFVKCWRVRNDGAAAWPENCCLVNAGGDEMFPETELRIPVPSAAAGEEVDISVHLTAPSATGRHVGYFRLQDDELCWFGQRLWADIRVAEEDVPWQVINSSMTMSEHEEQEEEDEQLIQEREREMREEEDACVAAIARAMAEEEAVEEAPAPTAPTEQMIWARELELLEAMGFTDSEVVIPLLKELVREPASAGQHPNPEGLQTVVLTLLNHA
jgi:hypothetical protein